MVQQFSIHATVSCYLQEPEVESHVQAVEFIFLVRFAHFPMPTFYLTDTLHNITIKQTSPKK